MPNSILDKEKYNLGGIARGLSVLGKKAIKNIDYDQAKTAKGDKSKGRMTRKDGTVYALMGDDMLKVAKTRSELKGAGKTAAVAGLLSLAASESWEEKNDTEPTKKQATAFEKAFSKAHNDGKETFKFRGKEYTTDVRKGKYSGGDLELSPYVRLTLQYEKELERAENPEVKKQIQKNYTEAMGNFSSEERVEGQKQLERMRMKRDKRVEGSLMVPPEMPVDTYTPEDQANAEETQLPDDEMEEDYIDFVLSEALQPEEQDYLMETLEADSRLSQIFDKVVETASEFSGAGEVEGPGTGVSDSIPARLSDGEFVMTRKATDQIGADNLQVMMDDAERAYDGGLKRMNLGGYMEPEESEVEESTDDEVERLMMASNRIPSVR